MEKTDIFLLVKKPYCTQNHGDCSTCSLVWYNLDCNNISLPRPEKKR